MPLKESVLHTNILKGVVVSPMLKGGNSVLISDENENQPKVRP
jgi:hypothetical protein